MKRRLQLKRSTSARTVRLALLMLALGPALTHSAVAETVSVGDFRAGDLSSWQEKSFVGNTVYRLVETEQGMVLAADTKGSASVLAKKMRVDLTRTPYLHWSWRVDRTFQGNDERSKGGDDYPARVYVVIDGGMLFWRTRALNYVWSSHQEVGTSWPNAFTSNAMMLAVRSGMADAGGWVEERRDVGADFKRLFGDEVTHVDAVAIMTDSDNTGQAAAALYGDIYFSDR